jgi:hypothetical protein
MRRSPGWQIPPPMRWQKRLDSKYSRRCRISGAPLPVRSRMRLQVTLNATTTKTFGAAMVHLFQILPPVKDNAGQPFAQKDFDRVKNELATEHGGVTAYLQSPAKGLWRQAGETETDHIVIFEVMTEEVDLLRWQKRRAELERRFRQDKVVIRYLPLTLV